MSGRSGNNPNMFGLYGMLYFLEEISEVSKPGFSVSINYCSNLSFHLNSVILNLLR